MDEALLARLDKITASLHDMDLKLNSIQSQNGSIETRLTQKKAMIDALSVRITALETLQQQAVGAAKAGRTIWGLLVALAGALGWFVSQSGLGRK